MLLVTVRRIYAPCPTVDWLRDFYRRTPTTRGSATVFILLLPVPGAAPYTINRILSLSVNSLGNFELYFDSDRYLKWN